MDKKLLRAFEEKQEQKKQKELDTYSRWEKASKKAEQSQSSSKKRQGSSKLRSLIKEHKENTNFGEALKLSSDEIMEFEHESAQQTMNSQENNLGNFDGDCIADKPFSSPNFSVDSIEDIHTRIGQSILTVISKSTFIQGDLQFEDPVQINGTIEGSIDSKSLVIVGKGAAANVNIKTKQLIILGKFLGSANCEDLAEIRSGATAIGALSAPRIAIQEQSYCELDIKMT